MADDSAEPGQNKFDIDDSVLDHAASKVVAVELNKRIPKAKENEQDPIPSDGKIILLTIFQCQQKFVCKCMTINLSG